MGKNSNIEWTDHTANFWWGCLKVSDGCKHCYAETLSNRWNKDVWGPPQTTSREYKKAVWKDVVQWNDEAKTTGQRKRVFVQSMADFFEDHPQVVGWRAQARDLMEDCTWLDFQVLTKRPENVEYMVNDRWLYNWPSHIWIGTSVENQETANERIPHLLKIPATVRFLSCEPLLGPVDLSPFFPTSDRKGYDWSRFPNQGDGVTYPFVGVNWVITGGESGPNARPCHPNWVRSIRDQCQQAGTSFFHKQWGEYCPGSQLADLPEDVKEKISGSKNMSYWMDQNGQLDKEFFPRNGMITNAWEDGWDMMVRVGKKNAGRMLDGQVWNEFPNADRERL